MWTIKSWSLIHINVVLVIKKKKKKSINTYFLPLMECSEGECQWHWCKKNLVPLMLIEPASPLQNTYDNHIYINLMPNINIILINKQTQLHRQYLLHYSQTHNVYQKSNVCWMMIQLVGKWMLPQQIEKHTNLFLIN